MPLDRRAMQAIDEICASYGVKRDELFIKWNKDIAVRRAKEDIAAKLYFEYQISHCWIWEFFDPKFKSNSLVNRLLENYGKRQLFDSKTKQPPTLLPPIAK